jgi:hypothetical protein
MILCTVSARELISIKGKYRVAMDALQKVLNPITGNQFSGFFHFASNAHRNGDCPCKAVRGSTSIWTAAETNDFTTVCAKIASNPGLISKLDAYGYSPLHYAAQQNNVEIVEYLLSKGADPDATQCGATALHRAAYAGSFESCELLLKAGANVNAIDTSYKDMRTPLHKASSVGNEKVIEILLKYGADASIQDSSGKYPADLLKRKQSKNVTTPKEDTDAGSRELQESSAILDIDDTNNMLCEKMGKVGDKMTGGLADNVALDGEKDALIKAAEVGADKISTVNNNTDVNVGLQCSQCGLFSLSFSRLASGQLMCTSCRYK